MLHNRAGFTIIEVMIVLMLAGVILLVVLLAVPALNRNNRNYRRRNDVALLLAEMSERAGNSGELPQGSCNNLYHPWCWVNEVNLGFYDNSTTATNNNISYLHRETPWSADPLEISQDEIPSTEPAVSTYETTDGHGYPFNRVSIRTYTLCDPNNVGHFTRDNATINSVAAQFLIETGTGYQLQCYDV